jgi:hypothetical protein
MDENSCCEETRYRHQLDNFSSDPSLQEYLQAGIKTVHCMLFASKAVHQDTRKL